MADQGEFANFMGINKENFSHDPDNLLDPKQYLTSATTSWTEKSAITSWTL
jgi:hypothetical protein